MSNKEIAEFGEKLQYGLDLAERGMLEEKALHGEDIVVSTDKGSIQRIPASEAIKNIPAMQ